MSTKSDAAVYEFGPFRLDESEVLLLRDGLPVPIKAKAFQLLLLLVRNAGHILMKDELMSHLWQNSFVEEHNLAVHVSELRKALGSEHQFIKTVSRHGYRFVAKVTKYEQPDFGSLAPAISVSYKRAGYRHDPITIAILPLKPITGDPSDEYLGMGLADVLITRLSVLRKVIVRSTSAVRKYAGGADPVAAGQELQVSLVLDGSIQRVGARIRVIVQLINVHNGATLWAGKYDESCADILALEDSISEQVASSLALELTLEESRRLMMRQTDNVEAYMAYMKGRFFWGKYSIPDINKSIEYFQQAITLDPNCAVAYVGLARAQLSLFSLNALEGKIWLPEIENVLDQALRLDNYLPEAHAIKALLRLYINWDWAGAEKEHQLAISFGHHCALAYDHYSIYLALLGRFDEALTINHRAQVLEPSSFLISSSKSRILFFAREYERSIYQLENILELNANITFAHYLMGINYDQLGEHEKAQVAYKLYNQLSSNNPEILASMSRSYALAGDSDQARRLLDEVLTLAQEQHVSEYYIAYAYLALGEIEKSLCSLEKACTEQDCELPLLQVDPRLDKLRHEPRFVRLLERVMGAHAALNQAGHALH